MNAEMNASFGFGLLMCMLMATCYVMMAVFTLIVSFRILIGGWSRLSVSSVKILMESLYVVDLAL